MLQIGRNLFTLRCGNVLMWQCGQCANVLMTFRRDGVVDVAGNATLRKYSAAN